MLCGCQGRPPRPLEAVGSSDDLPAQCRIGRHHHRHLSPPAQPPCQLKVYPPAHQPDARRCIPCLSLSCTRILVPSKRRVRHGRYCLLCLPVSRKGLNLVRADAPNDRVHSKESWAQQTPPPLPRRRAHTRRASGSLERQRHHETPGPDDRLTCWLSWRSGSRPEVRKGTARGDAASGRAGALGNTSFFRIPSLPPPPRPTPQATQEWPAPAGMASNIGTASQRILQQPNLLPADVNASNQEPELTGNHGVRLKMGPNPPVDNLVCIHDQYVIYGE